MKTENVISFKISWGQACYLRDSDTILNHLILVLNTFLITSQISPICLELAILCGSNTSHLRLLSRWPFITYTILNHLILVLNTFLITSQISPICLELAILCGSNTSHLRLLSRWPFIWNLCKWPWVYFIQCPLGASRLWQIFNFLSQLVEFSNIVSDNRQNISWEVVAVTMLFVRSKEKIWTSLNSYFFVLYMEVCAFKNFF